jgi:signal transduction histidine kinase
VRLEVTARPGGIVRFVVLDNGPGIDDDEVEQVFERFHRTDDDRSRKTGGAGLGLAIVRAIARAHGGDARAGGGQGPSRGGARLELELPRLRVRPAVPGEGPRAPRDETSEPLGAPVEAGVARGPRPPAADPPDGT